MRKLGFFTDPYEKELMYSAIARYAWYSGMCLKHTVQELYEKTLYLSFESVNMAKKLVDQFGMNYDVEEIINKHTTLNFYLPFMKEHQQQLILKGTKGEEGANVKCLLMMGKIYNQENSRIKYCPQCVREDNNKYGEPFLHREHQLPGVLVCSKHKCMLQNYSEYTVLDAKHQLIRLEYGKCIVNPVCNIEIPQEMIDMLVMYAKYAEKIVEGGLKGFNQQTIGEKYRQLLIRKGLASVTGVIKHNKLIDNFLAYYGQDVLEILGCQVQMKDNKENWINKIARPKNKITNPIKHVLFIAFLEPDIDSFFDQIYNNLSLIEAAPAVCVNKFCRHYMKSVVDDIKVINAYSRKYGTGYPFKLYHCKYCGMEYAKKIGNLEENYIIRNYGHEWEARIKDYLEQEKLEISEIAKRMECDKNIVIKYKDKIQKREKIYCSIQSRITQENIEERKKILLKIIKENPGITRTQIRKREQYTYSKILQVDPKWMDDILPPVIHKKNIMKTDWIKKDNECLKKMKKVYKMCIDENSPKRITYRYICEELNIKRGRLHEELKYMPHSKDFCYEILETAKQFKLRKCKRIVDVLYHTGKELTLERVSIELKIRRDKLKDVEEEVNTYIRQQKLQK